MRRYHSEDDDSARWEQFPFRDGDVVVSTRSKHGTTWMQMILLLLIHQRPDLPAPLPELSPWLDHLVEPLDDVIARLESQDHRAPGRAPGHAGRGTPAATGRGLAAPLDREVHRSARAGGDPRQGDVAPRRRLAATGPGQRGAGALRGSPRRPRRRDAPPDLVTWVDR